MLGSRQVIGFFILFDTRYYVVLCSKIYRDIRGTLIYKDRIMLFFCLDW